MGKIEIRVRTAEAPNIVADERWLHEMSAASDGEVLGKWAQYYSLLDDGILPEEDRDKAEHMFARLDFERRYRDGEFNGSKQEVLSGPSKYDVPSQIFRAACALYTHTCDAFSEDTLYQILGACDDIKRDDRFKTLSGEQRLIVDALAYEISQNLHSRSAAMSLREE